MEADGWTYEHDEGRGLRELFGLLLWDQIFDATVADAFCSPYQGAPLDLNSPHFYAARKASIDARLKQLAAAAPTELAELVRAAFDTHFGKCSAFVAWGGRKDSKEVEPPTWEKRTRLQILAVCFDGRALAAILLHMAATGMFAGMPDNTMIRARRRAEGGGEWELISGEEARRIGEERQVRECGGGQEGRAAGAQVAARRVLEPRPRHPRADGTSGDG